MPNWLDPVSGNWIIGALWDTGTEPGATDNAFVTVAGNYTITLNTSITVASLTLGDTGATLDANGSGDTDDITGDLSNAGILGIDSDPYSAEGGADFIVGGTLTNTGNVSIGPSSSDLSANTTLTVGALAGSGPVYLYGGYEATAPALALLDDLSTAPGTLVANTSLYNNAVLEYATGQIGTIAANVTLRLQGPKALVADASDTTTNSALTGLSAIDGALVVVDGNVTVDGDLAVSGTLGLDSDPYNGEGGSSFTVTGTLTNTGNVSIGPSSSDLSANTTLTVGALAGSGPVYLYGGYEATAPALALLDDLSAAPGTLVANTSLYNNAVLEYATGQIGTIAANVTLRLQGPKALVADASDTTTNSALTGLSAIDGALVVVDGNVTVDGDLAVSGTLGLDSDPYNGEGGSSFTVTGTLTNTGNVSIGPSSSDLSANTTLTVGALAGSGPVYLYGGYEATAPALALLDDLSAAPGTLVANTSLYNNAVLEYATGQIGTIAANVTLRLQGPKALVADASDTTTNSALTGLSAIDGSLLLIDGSAVTIDGDLTNAGYVGLDSDAYAGEGGSSFTVTGTLTNNGNVVIGPANSDLSANVAVTVGQLLGAGPIYLYGGYQSTNPTQALLDDLSAAPGTLVANTSLYNNALLEYATGQIGTIAANVTLRLQGPKALVADASDATTNSALTGLSENDGTLQIIYGNAVAIDGNLRNAGLIDLDGDGYSGEGGSSLTVTGTLTNNGSLDIGPGTGELSANTMMTVGQLAGTGPVTIVGNYQTTTSPPQATLDDLSAAPTVLAANTYLHGNALLEYASGQIGTIAANITLSLLGSTARVADAADTTKNSALTGLTEIDGALKILYGNTVAMDGNLLNAGLLDLDGDGYSGEGGSSLTVTGTLTNSGSLYIGPGTGELSANTTMTVGQLAGTGPVTIVGNYQTTTNPAQATLDDLSTAPTTLAANTYLHGNALLEYASGQIGTIAANITLSLLGSAARVADVGSTSTSSALTGLSEIDGALKILYGNTVAVGGNLLNAGLLDLDGDSYSGEGGSFLSVTGTLTNSGSLYIGPGTGDLSANTTLAGDSLDNTGSIALLGNTSHTVTVRLLTGASNAGALSIGVGADVLVVDQGAFTQAAGMTNLAGTLQAGTVDIANGVLAVNGGTVVANAIDFADGAGTLAVDAAATLPTIAGFADGDTLELLGADANSVNPTYDAATNTTSLAVTLLDTSVQTYTLAGDYASAPFGIDNTGGNALITTSHTIGPAAIPTILVDGTPLTSGPAPNTYLLDLGSIDVGSGNSTVGLSVLNAAASGGDQLDGSFAISGPSVFTNTGFSPFTDLSAGNSDTAPAITVSAATPGQFSENIVLKPVDVATDGVTTILPSETLFVSYSVVTPVVVPIIKTITSIFWGDVHVVDFDGLAYNFQAEGEFVLATSTVAGDTFEVQARLTPYGAGSSVSVMTQVGAQIGGDRVTFDATRTDTVWVDGVATSLNVGDVMQLGGGTLQEVSPNTYLLSWNSGESLTVQNAVSCLDVSLSLSPTDGPGSVEGLAGSDSGAASDFALANGTPIPQPLTTAQLYGEFANAWRVTQATSLLDYGAGQTTATFTDVNFPGDAITLANLPGSVVQTATQQTADAQITDPTIAQQADLDYAATGDASFLAGAQFAQSQGVVQTAADITQSSSVTPALGVQAAMADVTETQGGGATDATFIIYLTAAKMQDTLVDWAVTAPSAGGYLGASAFGGTLPSGAVVIPQGQTSAMVTVTVPSTAFGTEPNDGLQLTITAPGGDPVFAPSAQTLLINPNPEPGPPAGIAIADLSGTGTFTQTGNDYVLNLGTIEQNTGPLIVQIGVENTGVVGSDRLIGTFATSGPAAFTLTGFDQFGPVPGQGTDSAPHVTLSTGNTGTFTETVTLTPQDTNSTGYGAALQSQTLTITGTVDNLPLPVITAPGSLTTFVNMAAQFPTLQVSDSNAPDLPLTVVIAAAAGVLTAQATGAIGVAGEGTDTLTLTGNLADINAELASLTYTASAAGTDTVSVTVTDGDRASATQSIAIDTQLVPKTGAILVVPDTDDTVLVGQPSGLAGVQLVDPYDEAYGNVITVSFQSTQPTTILSVKGPSGAGAGAVEGFNSGTLTITGTVQQINALLADDLLVDVAGATSLGDFLLSGAKHQLSYYAIEALITGTGSWDTDTSSSDQSLVTLAGPESKAFLVGVTAASFALNELTALATGGTPPTLQNLEKALWEIVADAHVVSEQGTIYDFNYAGEFVLAASDQSGDTFNVQARLQPLGDSTAASIITQVGAQVGTDTVTFGADRDSVVWVDGSATTLSIGNPDDLSGGILTQVDADTYKISWNTGEVLTVIDSGSYLNVEIAAGPNNTASTLVGLENLSTTAGDDFILPDGTPVPEPATEAELADFVNLYRVPQQYSVLNYGPGQTTATFTDTTFPQTQITLADLPADVVANAAAVVAAAGITDPGIAAAAEFDYIASGGNISFVETDASLLAGRGTTVADITSPATPTLAIGVLPEEDNITANGGTTPVTFEAYLTTTSTSDTVIDWAVAAAGSGFLDAANFGSTQHSGAITIAAGQKTGTITVDVPAAALGMIASQGLEIQVTSPASLPIFAGEAQVTINQPVAGAPPVPQIVDLLSLGTFTQNGTHYTLDLGDVQFGEPLPTLNFGITNAANAPADMLSGTLSAATIDGFTVDGTSLPAPLQAGQSYNGIDVTVDYTKFGPNAETITFAPEDQNNTGYSSTLPTETLTIEDNVVAPTMVFSQAWGDVHIVTYNGLLYNFQAVGEFTLAKSRIPGDSFDIQLRLVPYYNIINGPVSIIQQVGVSLGADDITFDSSRATAVWVDGAPSNISMADPILNLADGTVTELSSTVWQVKWNSGEEATITQTGVCLNVSDGIPLSEPDMVGGLQGEDAGQANDFQLSDGTVLAQPLTYAQMYGEYANSWRVTQTSSLFNYGPGQNTQTFTDAGYPANTFDPDTLPASVQANAAALVAAAGITDPGIAAAAEEDYLATGDSSFITAAANVQQQVPSTTVFTPTDIPVPAPELGVLAELPGVVEVNGGTTAVTFDITLTAPLTTDETVPYAVIDGGTGYLGAATFGAVLPSGTITITAGETMVPVTIDVPANALGTQPNAILELGITPPSDVPVYATTATTTIANYQPEPGTPDMPGFADLTTPGDLTGPIANTYTLDLGTFAQGEVTAAEQIELSNLTAPPSDDLTGMFTPPLGSGFTVIGANLPKVLPGGQSYTGIYVTPQTSQAGTNTETLTFAPKDINDSGYTTTQPTLTLVITDEVDATATPALNTPETILFPNVRVGTVESEAISISNTAKAPAGDLSVTGAVSGAATVTGAISGLAPGATDATDLSLGLSTGAAGTFGGTVVLDSTSQSGDGPVLPASSTIPQIDVFGSVFRAATAAVTQATSSTILHVGDPGTVALHVANIDSPDGYSENLIADVTGTAGAITAESSGPTGDISAGAADDTSLAVSVSTTGTGTQTGSVTVALTSDGGSGQGSLDGLGQLALNAVTVPISVQVNNYAVAELTSSNGVLTAGSTPNIYTLDLGDVQQGSTPVAVSLDALNAAVGPADELDGSYAITGDPDFTNTGFTAFSGIDAGDDAPANTVALKTDEPGNFSETIVLRPQDSNSAGFSKILQAQTVTITGSVLPTGTATGDVHLVTFDGLHYNFQADGDFTLARSTVAGNPFDIQIATAPWAQNQAASVTTQAAAQVGTAVVRFGLGGSVTINGIADTSLNAAHPQQLLDGGTLTALGGGSYRLNWAGGEALTVANAGAYLNLSATLPASDGPGSVQGLLGTLNGQANDIALPDGTVLQQPVSSAEMLSTFAQAWSVAPGQSLLDGTVGASSGPEGSAGMTFLGAASPGQVLTGSLLGGDAAGQAVTFIGKLADFAGDIITNFAAHDVIDVTDLSSSLAAIAYTGSMTGGHLIIAAGGSSSDLSIAGSLTNGTFHKASDLHGGMLVSFS